MDSNIKDYETTLFEILATLNYNSERTDVLEEVLTKFLKHPKSMDIAAEARMIKEKSSSGLPVSHDTDDKNDLVKKLLFSHQGIINRSVPVQHVLEYLYGKYAQFAKEFENKYKVKWEALITVSFFLKAYIGDMMNSHRIIQDIYQYETKEEYGDPGFVKIPGSAYIDTQRRVLTIDKAGLYEGLAQDLTKDEIDYVTELLSYNANKALASDKRNLFYKPLTRFGSDSFVILVPDYLVKNLPVVYEKLLREIPSYLDLKGKAFEYLCQQTLKLLPFKTLAFNRKYGRYEVDAILELSRTNLIVEIKSHPPSERALDGELEAIKRDLEKTVRNGINQANRCIENLSSSSLAYFNGNGKRNQIFIIVDGLYPQLNTSNVVRYLNEKVTPYVINWFDLRTLIEQPDFSLFEEFLEWRTINPMPVFCFQETDYWSFYADRYRNSNEVRATFAKMQEMGHKLIYMSPRFNDKRYLSKIASN